MTNARVNSTFAPTHQRGLTLIEVLIAITLGSIVLLSVGMMYQTARRTMALNEGLSNIQESARFTLEYLFRNGQYAGWNPQTIVGFATSTTLGVQLLTEPLSNANIRPIPSVYARSTSSAVTPAYAISEGGANPDRLALLTRLSSDQDCYGSTRTGTYLQVFSVNKTNSTLDCTVYTYAQTSYTVGAAINGTQEISENITDLQIRYGIDSDGDGATNYFASASSITQVPETGFAASSSVAAVQIQVMITDPSANQTTRISDKTFSTAIHFIRK